MDYLLFLAGNDEIKQLNNDYNVLGTYINDKIGNQRQDNEQIIDLMKKINSYKCPESFYKTRII